MVIRCSLLSNSTITRVILHHVRHESTQPKVKPRFPEKGVGFGIPPGVVQDDQFRKNMMNWRASPEILILVGVVTFACGMGIYKLIASDAYNPETTWDRSTRSSFEKRVLERDSNKTESWEKGFWHAGPFKRPREMLGIIPSDPKLDYKDD